LVLRVVWASRVVFVDEVDLVDDVDDVDAGVQFLSSVIAI